MIIWVLGILAVAALVWVGAAWVVGDRVQAEANTVLDLDDEPVRHVARRRTCSPDIIDLIDATSPYVIMRDVPVHADVADAAVLCFDTEDIPPVLAVIRVIDGYDSHDVTREVCNVSSAVSRLAGRINARVHGMVIVQGDSFGVTCPNVAVIEREQCCEPMPFLDLSNAFSEKNIQASHNDYLFDAVCLELEGSPYVTA